MSKNVRKSVSLSLRGEGDHGIIVGINFKLAGDEILSKNVRKSVSLSLRGEGDHGIIVGINFKLAGEGEYES